MPTTEQIDAILPFLEILTFTAAGRRDPSRPPGCNVEACFRRFGEGAELSFTSRNFFVDRSRLTVTFRGKSCFLGNTLPFRFLERLAEKPNTFVPHEELLTDVWEGNRSDAAVRSVVKTLRRKLRDAGLTEVADAIDGTTSGHYTLKLSA